ncbi:MAG: hypothetical protein MMC23_006304 [Stictis urceolatum]|nr:hypothetical protein [Stictis urceolata]
MSHRLLSEIQSLQEQLRREQVRADQAEVQARSALPTTLEEYLAACHEFLFSHFAIQTDKSLTTKGGITNPKGKCVPDIIRPWHSFTHDRNTVFENLLSAWNTSQKAFASSKHLEELGNEHIQRRIGSEKDLEVFARLTLETPTSRILEELYKSSTTWEALSLHSSVTFENHPNTLSDVSEDVAVRLACGSEPITPNRHQPSYANLRADQICVYTTNHGLRMPKLVLEYKAPHKITLPHLRLGLREMNIHKEVVEQTILPDESEEDGAALFQYHSDRLIAAVMTQTYDKMLCAGLEYSVIFTGEALVFLRVPFDDPATLFYHLADPKAEVDAALESNISHLPYTSVGQFLSYCFLAIHSEYRDQAWRTTAQSKAGKWHVDDAAVLHEIPETLRKEPPSSAFVPRVYINRPRSAIVTRSKSCQVPKKVQDYRPEDSTECEDGESQSGLTPIRRPAQSQGTSPQHHKRQRTNYKGRSRSYCTQLCLQGLTRQTRLDPYCPNVRRHKGSTKVGHHRLSLAEFRNLLREQLALNLDNYCQPLNIQGSRGAIFKITLQSHGYTIVGKATRDVFVPDLRHEATVYAHLESLQGTAIPVCLGNIDLEHPYFYDVGVRIVHLLLLGWAGIPFDKETRMDCDSLRLLSKLIKRFGVYHGDLRDQNVVWNEDLGSPMLVDFERAEIHSETIPSSRKRKRDHTLQECPSNSLRSSTQDTNAKKLKLLR